MAAWVRLHSNACYHTSRGAFTLRDSPRIPQIPPLGEPAAVGEPGSRARALEVLAVLASVLSVSLLLWWRFLPLPHQDLNFYTEPAYLLATQGKLAGPASQYLDLTYQKGFYFYPPGYFLI